MVAWFTLHTLLCIMTVVPVDCAVDVYVKMKMLVTWVCCYFVMACYSTHFLPTYDFLF